MTVPTQSSTTAGASIVGPHQGILATLRQQQPCGVPGALGHVGQPLRCLQQFLQGAPPSFSPWQHRHKPPPVMALGAELVGVTTHGHFTDTAVAGALATRKATTFTSEVSTRSRRGMTTIIVVVDSNAILYYHQRTCPSVRTARPWPQTWIFRQQSQPMPLSDLPRLDLPRLRRPGPRADC